MSAVLIALGASYLGALLAPLAMPHTRATAPLAASRHRSDAAVQLSAAPPPPPPPPGAASRLWQLTRPGTKRKATRKALSTLGRGCRSCSASSGQRGGTSGPHRMAGAGPVKPQPPPPPPAPEEEPRRKTPSVGPSRRRHHLRLPSELVRRWQRLKPDPYAVPLAATAAAATAAATSTAATSTAASQCGGYNRDRDCSPT